MTTTIKQGQCPLISVKSNGQIQYRITTDASHQRYVQLLAATSGGCLSQDSIEVKDIKALLMAVNDNTHFSSTLFNPLFKGKSANNAAFLAAALRAEGVITQSKNHTYKHRILNIDAISLLKPVK